MLNLDSNQNWMINLDCNQYWSEQSNYEARTANAKPACYYSDTFMLVMIMVNISTNNSTKPHLLSLKSYSSNQLLINVEDLQVEGGLDD